MGASPPRSLRSAALLLIPLAVLAAYGVLAASPTHERVITNILIAVVLVIGIQLFSGNSGIISFGHVAFMGIGAYVAALTTIPHDVKESSIQGLPAFLGALSIDPTLSLALAALVSAIAAFAVGVALMRMEPRALVMATIGILVIFHVVAQGANSITRGPSGLFAIPQSTTLLSAAGLAAVVVVLGRLFRESSLGARLRASREDEQAAASLGIDVYRTRLVTWTISGALVGLGGGLWAQYNLAFAPGQLFFDQTFTLLAPLVLGGIATVSGAVVGVLMVGIVTELLVPLQQGFELGPLSIGAIPGLTATVLALLLLAVLRFRPQGLLGAHEIDELLRRWRDRKSLRDRRPVMRWKARSMEDS